MTMFLPVAIDHPAGTVNVAPPGVSRGVSVATRASPAELAATACGDADVLEAGNAFGAKTESARSTNRAVRRMDM
jgi:hypothetical protein